MADILRDYVFDIPADLAFRCVRDYLEAKGRSDLSQLGSLGEVVDGYMERTKMPSSHRSLILEAVALECSFRVFYEFGKNGMSNDLADQLRHFRSEYRSTVSV